MRRLGLRLYCNLMLWGHRVGCHQRADRSFFWHGYQFPICARCTGVLMGYLAAVPLYWIFGNDYTVSITAMLVMLLDWTIQFTGILESTNLRRLMTGICGGYGVMTIQITIILWFLNDVARSI